MTCCLPLTLSRVSDTAEPWLCREKSRTKAATPAPIDVDREVPVTSGPLSSISTFSPKMARFAESVIGDGLMEDDSRIPALVENMPNTLSVMMAGQYTGPMFRALEAAEKMRMP